MHKCGNECCGYVSLYSRIDRTTNQ